MAQLLAAKPKFWFDLAGLTALHIAVLGGHINVVKMHVAIRVGVGESLLREIWQAHPEVLNIRSWNKQTPYDLAVASKNEVAIEFFLQILPIDEITPWLGLGNFHRALLFAGKACACLFSYLTPRDIVKSIVFAYLGLKPHDISEEEEQLHDDSEEEEEELHDEEESHEDSEEQEEPKEGEHNEGRC